LLIKINNGVADQKNAFADQKNNSADHFTNSLFFFNAIDRDRIKGLTPRVPTVYSGNAFAVSCPWFNAKPYVQPKGYRVHANIV
jgi:hypothetical protein